MRVFVSLFVLLMLPLASEANGFFGARIRSVSVERISARPIIVRQRSLIIQRSSFRAPAVIEKRSHVAPALSLPYYAPAPTILFQKQYVAPAAIQSYVLPIAVQNYCAPLAVQSYATPFVVPIVQQNSYCPSCR